MIKQPFEHCSEVPHLGNIVDRLGRCLSAKLHGLKHTVRFPLFCRRPGPGLCGGLRLNTTVSGLLLLGRVLAPLSFDSFSCDWTSAPRSLKLKLGYHGSNPWCISSPAEAVKSQKYGAISNKRTISGSETLHQKTGRSIQINSYVM